MIEKNCRRYNVNANAMERTRLSADGKEVEFSTKFARFVRKRKKMCKIILDQKTAKSDYPCLAYTWEKMQQIRDYMKKRENIVVDWIYLVS